MKGIMLPWTRIGVSRLRTKTDRRGGSYSLRSWLASSQRRGRMGRAECLTPDGWLGFLKYRTNQRHHWPLSAVSSPRSAAVATWSRWDMHCTHGSAVVACYCSWRQTMLPTQLVKSLAERRTKHFRSCSQRLFLRRGPQRLRSWT